MGGRAFTNREIAKARSMRKQGYTYVQIASVLRKSKSGVANVLSDEWGRRRPKPGYSALDKRK